jgi:hypothetical protein
MTSANAEWITIASYENLPGRPDPLAAARA